MERKRLKIIQKFDKITTLVGTIIDSLLSNSSTDAPSIRAVNEEFSKTNNEINNLKDNGLAVSDTLLKKSQFLFDGDESELPSYLKKVDPPFSNPNLLMNGDLQVWERGERIRVDANSACYTSDRWYCSNIRTDTYINASKITIDTGKGTGLQSSTNGLRIYYRMDIADAIKLHGKKVTRKYSKNKAVSEAETYVFNVTEEDITNGYCICFYNVMSQDDVLNWVKLEVGEIATPLVSRSYDTELMLCKRYYAKNIKACGLPYSRASNIKQLFWTYGAFPIEMRRTPTITIKAAHVSNIGELSVNAVAHLPANNNCIYGNVGLTTNVDMGATALINYPLLLTVDADAEIY